MKMIPGLSRAAIRVAALLVLLSLAIQATTASAIFIETALPGVARSDGSFFFQRTFKWTFPNDPDVWPAPADPSAGIPQQVPNPQALSWTVPALSSTGATGPLAPGATTDLTGSVTHKFPGQTDNPTSVTLHDIPLNVLGSQPPPRVAKATVSVTTHGAPDPITGLTAQDVLHLAVNNNTHTDAADFPILVNFHGRHRLTPGQVAASVAIAGPATAPPVTFGIFACGGPILVGGMILPLSTFGSSVLDLRCPPFSPSSGLRFTFSGSGPTDMTLGYLGETNGVFGEIDPQLATSFFGSFLNLPILLHETQPLYVGVDLVQWLTFGESLGDLDNIDLFDGTSDLLPGFIVGTSPIFLGADGYQTLDPFTGNVPVVGAAGLRSVPEPGTGLLVGLALAGLWWRGARNAC